MDCPSCGKDLIVDQFEDCELVYCSCGYTKLDEENEDCMCEECELGNNGEPVYAIDDRKAKDDWPFPLSLTDKEDF